MYNKNANMGLTGTIHMPPDCCDQCHPWTPLCIYRGDLFDVDTKNLNMGLTSPVDP